jgi:hypothetical protein
MEILVAVVLAGLLALLIHRGLGLYHELEARGVRANEQVLANVGMRGELEGWLQTAFAPTGAQETIFAGEAVPGPDGTRLDRLWFLTHLRDGPARVSLAVEGGSGLVARIGRQGRWGTPGREDTLHLVPSATGLAIRYALDVGDRIVWTGTWSSTARLPDAVELLIEGDSVPPLVRVPIVTRMGGAQ